MPHVTLGTQATVLPVPEPTGSIPPTGFWSSKSRVQYVPVVLAAAGVGYLIGSGSGKGWQWALGLAAASIAGPMAYVYLTAVYIDWKYKGDLQTGLGI